MLQSLIINNYALIENIEIKFRNGFSVITGETGAGKSIIISALSTLLGAKTDTKIIRQGADKCVVEATFDVSKCNPDKLLADKNLDSDGKNCILRREISGSGKSRAFVNDTPTNLNDLKEIASKLIDIHSQHQNLMLADNHFQLQVIDSIAQNQNLQNNYKSSFEKYLSIKKQIENLKNNIAQQQAEEDYIKFQFNRLNDAQLKPDEQETLETERKTIANAQEIKSALHKIEYLLSEEESGIVEMLNSASVTAKNLCKIYPHARETATRLQSAYIDLKDLLPDLRNLQENLYLDQNRLEKINARLDLIYSLQKKHQLSSVQQLITLQNSLAEQINTLDYATKTLETLEKTASRAFEETRKIAELLSLSRKKAAVSFETQLIETVRALALPSIRFSVRFTQKTQPDTTGTDDVTFLFSANRNSELRPVASTASGGEISRLMLGIKSLIADVNSLPTIIFDEADSGVSGETANKTANILLQMGQRIQVIAISHLPQIAAKGQYQYHVYKKENHDSTETHIRKLSPEERVTEIARILSGDNPTNAALENARILLNPQKITDKN
jgi:DNA repair protein RecN (Recombination protein N)